MTQYKVSLAWIYGLIAVIGLLFFRPLGSFKVYSEIDDRCYVKYASQWVGEETSGCINASYPPGIGFFWLPATIPSKIVAALSYPQDSNLKSEYYLKTVPVWIAAVSFLYWAIAFILFFQASRIRGFTEKIALFLGVPVLYYATHRTTMVHAVEIFLSSVTYFCVVKKKIIPLFLSAIALVSLRLNDFPVFFLLAAIFWNQKSQKNRVISEQAQKRVKVIIAIVLALLLAWIVWIAWFKGYHSMKITNLIQRFSFKRILAVFVGGDWGLLFTGFFYVFAFGYGAIRFFKTTLLEKACFFWLAIEFAIIVGWRGNGSDFGYRYLIGASTAAWILLDRAFSDWPNAKWPKLGVVLKSITVLSALLNLWMTWTYKIFPATTPVLGEEKYWTIPQFLKASAYAISRTECYTEPLNYSILGSLYVTQVNIFHPSSLLELERVTRLSRDFLNLACIGIIVIFLIFILKALLIFQKNRTSPRS